MAAAGPAGAADAVRAGVELAGMGLDPADRVIDVLLGGRVRRVHGGAELDRHDDEAALRQVDVRLLVLQPLLALPGATVYRDHGREGAGARGLVDARRESGTVLDVAVGDLQFGLGVISQ